MVVDKNVGNEVADPRELGEVVRYEFVNAVAA
jgi:hypothetical protein